MLDIKIFQQFKVFKPVNYESVWNLDGQTYIYFNMDNNSSSSYKNSSKSHLTNSKIIIDLVFLSEGCILHTFQHITRHDGKRNLLCDDIW